MNKDHKEHPLNNFHEDEKVAYLSIIASLIYIDKDFAEEERKQLESLILLLNISDSGKGKIFSAVFSLNEAERFSYLDIMKSLNKSDLKFTLISDLCLIALADSVFLESEYEYILDIAKYLDISKDQVDAIKVLQENLFKASKIPKNSEMIKGIVKEGAASLASVGVPAGAIALSGTVFGLSATGITSGLATLGALVGGGMLAGVVLVVPALAVGSYFGVKALINLVKKEKDS